jgi:hypothetical protein
MEAARKSETSVDNFLTRQYTPEDNSKLQTHIQIPQQFNHTDYVLPENFP